MTAPGRPPDGERPPVRVVRPGEGRAGDLGAITVDFKIWGADTGGALAIVEHEFPPARVQDRARVLPILQGSVAFVRHIDEAAACMHALQHDVLPAQGLHAQGIGREAYRS